MGAKHRTDKLHAELHFSTIYGCNVKMSNDIIEISIGRVMSVPRVFVNYIIKFKKPSNAKFV